MPSEENPADLTTRISHADDLTRNSIWQRGPEYLKHPVEIWPIRRDCNITTEQLPDRIGVVLTSEVKIQQYEKIQLVDLKLERFHNYNKLLRVTSIILAIAKMQSYNGSGQFKGIFLRIGRNNFKD